MVMVVEDGDDGNTIYSLTFERRTTIYGYAFSLFLIAIGAILKFAVTTTVNGFRLDVAGVILIIIGIVGLVFTFAFRLLDYDEGVKHYFRGPRDDDYV
jgi:hypothetical protein